MCQAEGMDGRSACALPATLQTQGDPGETRNYYCHRHTTSRQVWDASTLEPMHPTAAMMRALTAAYDEEETAHGKTATLLHEFLVKMAAALGVTTWWKRASLLERAAHLAKTCGTE